MDDDDDDDDDGEQKKQQQKNTCTIYCMWSLDSNRSIICTLRDKEDNLWT